MCSKSCCVNVKKIESNVIAGLQASILSGDLQYKIVQSVSKENFNELELLKEQLNRVHMKERRIQDAYENGIDTIDEYKANKLRLQEEKRTLENKIQSLTASETKNDSFPKQQIIHNLESALEMLSDPAVDYEKKGVAIRSVVDKIVYDKKTEHLDFFFYLSKP